MSLIAGLMTLWGCGGMPTGSDAGGQDDGGQDDGGTAVECGGCLVGSVCYAAGEASPDNPCEVCAPGASTTTFSPADGLRCDDGSFCTVEDTCAAGACVGAARSCADGIDCNGEEQCDEEAGACTAGAPTCEADQLCDAASDACVTTCTGCVIDGVCYGAGQRNAANACEVCDPSASTSAWSANEGASCDDGLFCTQGDVCAGTVCAGAAVDLCGDGTTCNGEERCDEDTDRCVAGAPTCASGQLCDVAADACVTTCSGCVIGGVCYGAGQRNPANECEVCDVSASTSAWTANAGASCDDGLFCTAIDACTAGAACVGAARECGDGVACNGAETCDEAADRCLAGTPTCAGGTVCSPATDACTVTCASDTTACGALCVDTTRDAAHCGACDTSCARDNAIGECATGDCRFACLDGFGDCDGDEANGCEVRLDSAAHCGVCGNACAADEGCMDGVCRPLLNTVSGVVFADADADGVRGPAELGVSGRVVFLDANGDGALDAGELSTTTDAAGAYLFPAVAAGSYSVREVQDASYLETAPGTYAESSDDFSAAAIGAMWTTSGDGISQSGGLLTVARNAEIDRIELARRLGSRFEIRARVRLDRIFWNDAFHGLAISAETCTSVHGFDVGYARNPGRIYMSHPSGCHGKGFFYSSFSNGIGVWREITISGTEGDARVSIDGTFIRETSYPLDSPLVFSMPGFYTDGDGPGMGAADTTQTSWDEIVIRDSQPGGHDIVLTGGQALTDLDFGNL